MTKSPKMSPTLCAGKAVETLQIYKLGLLFQYRQLLHFPKLAQGHAGLMS